MAPQLGNYVLETATAPGTGSFTLNGPETDRRSFSTAFPNGGSVFYFADDGSSAEWGVGTLTIGTPSTLSRTTIIGTTSGGTSALNFSGSVEVYNEIPAEYVPVLEQDGSLTLAGSLTVRGKTLVQNVADFTSQEAIPAAQADGRYLQRVSSVNTSLDFAPNYAGINRTSGAIWLQYKDDGGTDRYAFAQPSGDYATQAWADGRYISSPFNPTTDYRITAISRNKTSGGIFAYAEDDSNTQLQAAGECVLKTGDTISWLQVSGATWTLGNSSAVYNSAVSRWTNSYVDSSGSATWDLNGGSPSNSTGNINWLRLDTNGSIRTGKGAVALTSQLPFTDQNLRVQVFNATASNGAFVTLPQAFSTLVGVTAQQHSSGGEGIRPIRIETNVFRGNGFNVSIWSEGGGIQYTFVAYGYF
ncbi:hypothetical protein QQM41_10165 [Acetobacter sp. AC2005]|uniref:hypothetical protein n=1 Tax=Acetobacter sp. AC2005 TaxID=3134142 RepID=UPI0030D2115C